MDLLILLKYIVSITKRSEKINQLQTDLQLTQLPVINSLTFTNNGVEFLFHALTYVAALVTVKEISEF